MENISTEVLEEALKVLEETLQPLMVSRIEKLQAIQRRQEKEGVAPGEHPVITVEALSREIGTQTDIEFSDFDENAYATLPESAKEKLYLLEQKMALADASGTVIFDDIYSVFKALRKDSKFYTNQACFQQCLKLAVECVKRLSVQVSAPADMKKCFQMTQRMFQYYFAHTNDNRAVLVLHLQLRDILENNDSLIHLMHDEIGDSLLDLEETTHKATQTRLSQHLDVAKEHITPDQSSNHFSERWTELQSISMKPKALNLELSKLSDDISQYAYAHKRSMQSTEWKTFLSLALAVEARFIEHMQSARDEIWPLSKAMQRAAHYFRLLHIYYQHSGASEALKAEIKKSYDLMEERSTNYEQMLACYYVETSEKTSSSEKENARKMRGSYQSEMLGDTTALCAQYQTLSQPLNSSDLAKHTSKPEKEMTLDERRILLETDMLAGSKSAYICYQNARQYLNAVLNQALPKSTYDVKYLHQLDNYYDADVMGIYESLESEQLLSLALNDSSGMLKHAVQLYYDTKCRHLDELYKMHPSDKFVKDESFCTHFRKEAYAFLLQSCTPGHEIKNLGLFKRNCLDILNAENYRAPLLEALARHGLDTMAPYFIAEATSEQQPQEETGKKSNPEVTSFSTSKASPSTQSFDEETIWTRLCAEYAFNSVCFRDYLDKITKEGFTDEAAEFLYEAITDSDKRLLLDKDKEATFFELYQKLLTEYYTFKEYQVLEDAKAEHILNAKEHAKIPADKLMPKTIKLGEALLQYSRVYDDKRQLDALLLLGDVYIKLQQLVPKRAYKTRAEAVYREAMGYAKEMENAAELVSTIMKAMRLLKTAPLETKQAGQEALSNSGLRENEAEGFKNNGLFHSTEKAFFDFDRRVQLIHQLGDNLILRSHIVNLAHSTIYVEEYYDKVVLFFKYLYQKERSILPELAGHASAMLEYYASLPSDLDTSYLKRAEQCHQALASYCATMDEVVDDQFLCLSENTTAPIKIMLLDLEDKMQRAGSVKALPTIDDMRQRKISAFPLSIPDDFRRLSTLSDPVREAFKLIDKKQYWQALKFLSSEDILHSSPSVFQQVLFLNACMLEWLVKIILAPHFKASLGDNEHLIRSYDYAVQVLLDTKKSYLIDARKNKVLRKMCDTLLKGDCSVLESSEYLQACSLFNSTDEKASGHSEAARHGRLKAEARSLR